MTLATRPHDPENRIVPKDYGLDKYWSRTVGDGGKRMPKPKRPAYMVNRSK